MMTAAWLYELNPLGYFPSQKRGEGAASGASARSPEMNTKGDAKGKTTQTATDTTTRKAKHHKLQLTRTT
jgi:hypothetical protein